MRVACAALLVGGWLGCEREAPAPLRAPATPEAARASSPTVYFKDLRAFLPQVPDGYHQVKDRGSTGKYGEVSVSEAERVFRKREKDAEREISVRIVDTTLVTRLG